MGAQGNGHAPDQGQLQVVILKLVVGVVELGLDIVEAGHNPVQAKAIEVVVELDAGGVELIGSGQVDILDGPDTEALAGEVAQAQAGGQFTIGFLVVAGAGLGLQTVDEEKQVTPV